MPLAWRQQLWTKLLISHLQHVRVLKSTSEDPSPKTFILIGLRDSSFIPQGASVSGYAVSLKIYILVQLLEGKTFNSTAFVYLQLLLKSHSCGECHEIYLPLILPPKAVLYKWCFISIGISLLPLEPHECRSGPQNRCNEFHYVQQPVTVGLLEREVRSLSFLVPYCCNFPSLETLVNPSSEQVGISNDRSYTPSLWSYEHWLHIMWRNDFID